MTGSTSASNLSDMAIPGAGDKAGKIKGEFASLEFLTDNDWVLIASRARQLRFSPEEEIIRQDSHVNDLYVFRRGTARI